MNPPTHLFPRPVKLLLDLTYRCHRRCTYCMQSGLLEALFGAPSRAREREMTTAQIKDILSQASLLDVKWVNLSGGEPLLRRDILELVWHAASLGLRTGIPTKLAPSAELLGDLGRAGLTRIGFGLDAPDADLADRLVGERGYFDRCTAAVRAARRLGLEVMLMPVVTRPTLGSFERLLKLADELGVDGVHPQVFEGEPLLLAGYASGRNPGVVERLQLEHPAAVQRWIDGLRHPLLAKEAPSRSAAPGYPTFCAVGAGTVSVRADGKVYFCPHLMDVVVGDATVEPLETIWFDGRIRDILLPGRELFAGTRCHDCSSFARCRAAGRCALRCLRTHGRLFAPDPAVCVHPDREQTNGAPQTAAAARGG